MDPDAKDTARLAKINKLDNQKKDTETEIDNFFVNGQRIAGALISPFPTSFTDVINDSQIITGNEQNAYQSKTVGVTVDEKREIVNSVINRCYFKAYISYRKKAQAKAATVQIPGLVQQAINTEIDKQVKSVFQSKKNDLETVLGNTIKPVKQQITDLKSDLNTEKASITKTVADLKSELNTEKASLTQTVKDLKQQAKDTVGGLKPDFETKFNNKFDPLQDSLTGLKKELRALADEYAADLEKFDLEREDAKNNSEKIITDLQEKLKDILNSG